MTNYSDLWRRLSDGFGKNLAPPFRSPEIKVAFFVIAKSRNKKKKNIYKDDELKWERNTWAMFSNYAGTDSLLRGHLR